MTISYAGHHVARLLVRWKGSVWKSTWKELLAFLLLYYAIRVVYRLALTDNEKMLFETVSFFCTPLDLFWIIQR